jgi:putative ATP-dependent endonuclease of OLD family
MVIAGVRAESEAFLFLQHLAVGGLHGEGPELRPKGLTLLSVPVVVGRELFALRRESTALRTDLRLVERVIAEPGRAEHLMDKKEGEGRYFLQAVLGPELRHSLSRHLFQLGSSSSNVDELKSRLSALLADMKEKIEVLNSRETEGTITAFAGATKAAPAYAAWLMKEYGAVPLLHLRETRDPIGREEAEALLTLKVTRGGPERLQGVQKTVRSLLGVEVDAFQSEDARRGVGRSGDRGAEMDIDRFLVEANGAGVREALRLILDLELKKPKILLLEEPEAHLHPGLEHAVYSYLRDRSQTVQMFVTTHSTNFVDSISFQNIYLVSRDQADRTAIERLDAGEGALRMPAELGLRLSTVFMYDRLVFVEGPSDEAVIRELAKTLDIDLARANVGFVQMGGVRNFAHFAAQSTIGLLARRRIRLWFVADRDEKDDAEVMAMVQRLGEGASVKVLERRELENYLLDASAVARFIGEKRLAGGLAADIPAEADVETGIVEEARL